MLEYRLPGAVQTGAAVGPGLGALVYAGLYAVPPEAISWRALFAGADLAFPETRVERRGAGSAAFVCGSGHTIHTRAR